MMLDGNPVAKVHCMSVARADRVYGRLMLFLKDRTLPEREHLDLLTVVAQDISMVIESQMLRTRELAAISQIQKAPRHRGLRTELSEMLQSIAEVMQVDGGLVVLGEGDPSSMKTTAATGAPTEDTLRLIRGIARGVSLEDKPLVINKLSPTGQGTSEVSSLMVTSLPIKENRKGILALWSSQENAFNKRHIQLAEVFSGQTAVAIDNHITLMQIAYQAELAERSRLAREIHDGIAQMLGLMKLQAGQIAQWLQTDQLKRAYEGISGIQNLATKAYMDAREAIDGLQIQSKEGGISIWIEEVLEQFSSLSGIEIESNPPPSVQLAPEIQLQLIRITQEALSNIRKHSRATKVTLEWQDMGDQLALRICDNGIGFDVQDIPVKSQHGLHTMRERAELLDAELSITSNPKGGTKVYIQLPINTIGIPA